MKQSNTQQQNASGSIAAGTANTRLSGSWLLLARAVWLALVLPSVALFIAGLPVYYAQLQRACIGSVECNIAGALTARGLQALLALGVSASEYATFYTIFWVIIAAIWCGIGFLLFWRRSDDWLALLAAFFLVMFVTTFRGLPISVLALAYPALNLPTPLMSAIGQVSIGAFFLLFPSGRLVPRWMAVFLLLLILQTVSSLFPLTSPFNANTWPGWLTGLLDVVSYAAIIFSQVYRYRRVSTPLQRQQTKWVVFGIITVAAGFIVLGLLFVVFFPEVNQPDSPYSLLQNVYPLLTLLLPLSIGIAVLRYRLYDIDILINRTLVYGTLTASLALVYFGLVIGLESLVRLFTGQVSQTPVVIVASTLAIAALFQPLRRRIQIIIDRRFYRRKYDAARTLAAFSATLRNEVDLHQLCEHLVAVVQETMQPAHVSLWLRSPQKRQVQEEEPPLSRRGGDFHG